MMREWKANAWLVGLVVLCSVLACAAVIAAPKPKRLSYRGNWARTQTTSVDLQTADVQFAKKNYRQALEAYQRFLTRHPNDGLAPRAILQRVRCHRMLMEYDQALAALRDFIKRRPGTLWEARADVLKARFYAEWLPRYGYERGKTISYNREERHGRYRYLYYTHQKRAVELRERARELYRLYLAASGSVRDDARGADVRLEACENELALIEQLEHSAPRLADPQLPHAPLTPPKPSDIYRPDWPGRTKILFLAEEIRRLDAPRPTHEPSWHALYLKAKFLAAYPTADDAAYRKRRKEARTRYAKSRKNGATQFHFPPYDPGPSQDPVALMKRALREARGGKKHDLYLAFLGRVYEHRKQYALAREVYVRFLARYPKSRYFGDVKAALLNLRKPFFYLGGSTVSRPATLLRWSISARNTRSITIDIYRVDLERAFGRRLVATHPVLYSVEQLFGKVSALGPSTGERVARLVYRSLDEGDHRMTSGYVTLPRLPVGAYVFHARGPNYQIARLFLVTNRIVLEATERGKVHYLVTDGTTGRPIAGARLTVKESYYDSNLARRDSRSATLRTDARGRATYVTRTSRIGYSQVEALVRDGEHYAITGTRYLYLSHTKQYEQFKVFTTTDRPVYRPGQLLKFKHVVRIYREGRYKNAPGLTCRIRVLDAKNAVIFEKFLKTSANGSLMGELRLDPEAALGRYRVDVWVKRQGLATYQSAGRYVRVEEYKKPEFEVKVVPNTELARPGQKLRATIRGVYYFGGPVVSANVSYAVYRTTYWHSHTPASRFDWLYGKGYGIIFERPYVGRGELVASGKGLTNARGELTIDLPTPESDGKHDWTYTIQATVRDLSRRTIQGAGSIKVTRDPFFVYLYPHRGFYAPNDELTLKLHALTANDAPIRATGKLTIERVRYALGQKPTFEAIRTLTIGSDREGEGEVRFVLAKSGSYRLSAELRAADGGVGRRVTWVYVVAERCSQALFRFDKLRIRSKKRTYRRGEFVELLITSPVANATVWFAVSGGDELLHQRVLTLDGTAARVRFPATGGLSPNFQANVAMIHDFKAYLAQRALYVPPADKILDVRLTADKPSYKPGEKGRFQIRVRDSKGRPVATELSLSVFDASLLYIQRETTGDIRSYFYGKRRYISTRLYHSAQFYSSAVSVSDYPIFRYKSGGLPSIGRHYLRRYYRGGYGKLDDEMDGQNIDRLVDRNTVVLSKTKSEDNRRREGGKNGKKRPEVLETPRQPVNQPGIRKAFADTALWAPAVTTNARGLATVTLRYPENLTTWAVRAIAITGTTRVGRATLSVRTTKRLVARLEMPRFLVEGDRVSFAAIVHNKTAKPMQVALQLTMPSALLKASGELKRTLLVPPHASKRVDFQALALRAGKAVLTLHAEGGGEQDGLRLAVPISAYGAKTMVTRSGVLRKAGSLRLQFTVPKERRKETTALTLVLEPSLGGVLLSALPYLIDYPYGCVEQTMSRFLPAALVARTLRKLGIKLEAIPALKEKASLLHPLGREHAWWRSPVFDRARLNAMVRSGFMRLYRMQHSDGGWGWWSGGTSDAMMSAYVLMGLVEARKAGYDVRRAVITRGFVYLSRELELQKAGPLRVYLGYVLSTDGRLKKGALKESFTQRDALSAYSRALLALALHHSGSIAEAQLVTDNLLDGAWVDKTNGTASFKPQRSGYWWWYNDRVESVAWMLRAVMTIRPTHALRHAFAKWLVLNRQGSRWSHTRSTAMSIYALTRYLNSERELEPDYRAIVKIGGKVVKELRVTSANVLTVDGGFLRRGDAIADGPLAIEIELVGRGSLYASAFLRYVSKERQIPAQGNEIFVKREYFKLVPQTTLRSSWRGPIKVRRYKRVPLREGASLDPGDLVEVRLTVDAKNDYSYLVFEDYKPAGLEAVELKSGYRLQHGLWYQLELRDRKAAIFVRRLAQGRQVLSYRLRASNPGHFNAMPHQAHAMYAPRVRANSTNLRLSVTTR